MKKKLISIAAIISLSATVHAQQVPLYSLGIYQPLLYNPAFAGLPGDVNFFLAHRDQWNNYPGAPQTTTFGVDAPFLSEQHGIGLNFHQHREGWLERQGLLAMYAHHLRVTDNGAFHFGIAFGITDRHIDFTQALVKDADDPYLLGGDIKRTSADAQAGILFTLKQLELGLSVPQLLGNTTVFYTSANSSAYHSLRQYIFSAKEKFMLDEGGQYTLSPMLMVHAARGVPAGFDLAAVLGIKQTAWLGLFYRSRYAVGANIRVNIYNQLALGYSFASLLGDAGTYRGYTHEILLSYSFHPVNSKKETENVFEKYQQEIEALNARVTALSDSLSAGGRGNETGELKKMMADLASQIAQLKKDTEGSDAQLKMKIALLEEKVNLLVKLMGN